MFKFFRQDLENIAPKRTDLFRSPIITRSKSRMASNGNNNSANETNSEHRMDTMEQTLMKVAEQVQLLTSTFSLLKEVQPPQGDTSGARKEANPTAEDEVNYVPTRDNGATSGK